MLTSRSDNKIEECPVDKSEKKHLNDLLRIGPDKPLGYLPIDTVENICKVNLNRVERYLQQKGIETRKYSESHCNVYRGALYAYDTESLQKLLDDNLEILVESGWPTQADTFVTYVVTESAEHYTPLFDLVADAFADYTNGWRMNKKDR